MANGNSGKVQFGIESTYADPADMEAQVRFSSEGFKYTPNKQEEGLLTGLKGQGRSYTMGVKAEGSLSTNVRPDEAGYWLALGLGSEDTPVLESGATNVYIHTFTAIGNTLSDHLPSATFTVDRIVDVFQYPGCKITDFSFSASPGDYLKLDANFVGKDEEAGTIDSGLTPSSLKPFRFQHGQVLLAGSPIADITSINFSYNNNPETDLQTTSTGLYYKEPEAGAREITMELEVLYTEDSETIRQDYYKTDDALSVEIVFTSDEEIETDFPYQMNIIVPNAQVSESDSNIGGADRLTQSLNLRGIDEVGSELITVELINDKETAYI